MSGSIADTKVLTGPPPVVPPGPTPRHLAKHLDFLEWSADGETLLVGTSDLTSRAWNGSVWLFSSAQSEGADQPGGWRPSAEKCIVGAAIDCGVTAGRFLDSSQRFVIGCDSGALLVLVANEVGLVSNDNNESHSKVKLLGQGTLSEHNDTISSLDSLGSGCTDVVSGSQDKSIKVWDLDCLVSKLTFSPAHAHIVTAVSAHHTDSNIFSSCALDGSTLLWDIRNSSPASGVMKSNGVGFTSLAWTNDHVLAIGAVNGQLSLVDIRNTSEPLAKSQLKKRPIHGLRSKPGNSSIVGACQDSSSVDIVQFSSTNLQTIYSNDSHGDFVRGISWHPQKHSFWTCGWDSKVFEHQLEKIYYANGPVIVES